MVNHSANPRAIILPKKKIQPVRKQFRRLRYAVKSVENNTA